MTDTLPSADDIFANKIFNALASTKTDINGTTYLNWNNSLEQPLSISFSFFSYLPSYYFNPDKVSEVVNFYASDFVMNFVDINNPLNFQAFNPGQLVATNLAMDAWSAVANIKFDFAGYNNPFAVIALGNATFLQNNYGYTMGSGSSLVQGENNP